MARRFNRGRASRFFKRKPVKKEQPFWQTVNFNEASQAVNGDITENLILQQNDIIPSTVQGRHRVSVRRIIVNGGVAVSTEFTTAAQDIVTLFAALYVIEDDDSDNTLVTTAVGDILEGGAGRVLWTNCYTCTIREVPLAQWSNGVEPAIARIEIDWKGRLNLTSRDEFLVLGLEFGGSVTSTIAVANTSLTCRTLQVID